MFDGYDFTQEILDKAYEILRTMTDKVRRSKNRKRYIFYCLYQAHRSLGYVVDQYELAKKIGMDPRDISKSKSLTSDRGKTYVNNIIHTLTISDCLPSYYEEFFLNDSHNEDINNVIDVIKNNYPSINYTNPHINAAILCMIHAEYNGCIVDRNNLMKMLCINYDTFLKTYKLLNEIYYSIEQKDI